MKLKRINQINAFCERNEVIQLYNWLGTDKVRYSDNWRNRYYTFVRGGRNDRISISGNFTYGAALTEFERYINGKNDYGWNYHRDNRSEKLEYYFNGHTLYFEVQVSQSINGVWLNIRYNNFKETNNCETMSKRFLVRSNSTFADLDIKQYFEKNILSKYLFAPGLFRNIQIVFNYTKKEAIEYYKKHCAVNRAQNEFEAVDSLKTLKQRVCKKLNILVECDKTEKELINLLHTTARQKTRKKLFRFPSVWELSEMYSSQYDDDENMESFVSEIESDYPKNAIFI